MDEPGAGGTQDVQGPPAGQPSDPSSLVLCDLGPWASHQGACHLGGPSLLESPNSAADALASLLSSNRAEERLPQGFCTCSRWPVMLFPELLLDSLSCSRRSWFCRGPPGTSPFTTVISQPPALLHSSETSSQYSMRLLMYCQSPPTPPQTTSPTRDLNHRYCKLRAWRIVGAQ